eukprot:TRINITY_DN4505_c0_g2_i1.p1 TRINITY_DN4505_c0_g2~~TRINITY_DN4505_c0_g2_i1.p1  ORF type:complete len:370 (-),score=83.97 TRINITY_DN4505_c0_g2_i1:989-2098(-)
METRHRNGEHIELKDLSTSDTDQDEEFDEMQYNEHDRHFSIRSVAVGLLIGCLMCFSNMYFGLQTGWITMGSLQSSLLGFGVFKILAKGKWAVFQGFGPLENVVLQSTAVAAATMPLAGGFVGIIPALGMLRPDEMLNNSIEVIYNWWGLLLWGFALAFFGVFFAVPLRRQVILKEKLRFPSGTATAHMIRVFHRTVQPPADQTDADGNFSLLQETEKHRDTEWNKRWKVLAMSLASSSAYAISTYFIPVLQSIPIFTWIGLSSVTAWNWTITPSPSYIGQGMIMGTNTGLSMLAGAITGWGILGPMATKLKWVSEDVNNWETGGKGWILWISLSIMMSEAIVSLLLLIGKMSYKYYKARKEGGFQDVV